MPTAPPEQVRGDLQSLTTLAAEQVAAIGAFRVGDTAESVRAALFDAAEVIAETHRAAAAELAVAWYDQLREAADLTSTYLAAPVAAVDLKALQTTVAVATTSLYDLIQADIDRQAAEYEEQLVAAVDASVAAMKADLQKEIAAGFRDTILENVREDPDAIGWRRFTAASDSYDDGCRFCRFLADKGAIFTRATARFAAHKKCHCLAGPAFTGDDGPRASVMQYVASKRKRTKAENKRLRDLLDDRYGPEERVPAADGGGRGGKPPGSRPGPAGADDGLPDRSDSAAWDAYWDRRRAALPAAYNAKEMLPPLEVEFAERMHALAEDIEWISQAGTAARIDPKTGNWLPVHDFKWGRFDTEWEHKGLEPGTPVDAVHIARQITKSTKKGKLRVVVDVGDRALPDGTLDELSRYNLNPARPSAAAVWVMAQGQLHKVDLADPAAEK
jgi:hypothetical protein